MIVERRNDGSYLISDIVGNYWVKKQYFGYTKREAMRLFRQEFLKK